MAALESRPIAGPISFARPSITDEDVDAVVSVLRSGWTTTGPMTADFERDLEAFLSSEHVVTTSSATAALEICLAHLGLPRGARVGVPAWTFAATALAVGRTGAKPVLIDVNTEDLNISLSSLEAAIEIGLDAVVAVHFAGVAFSDEITDLCAEAGIPLIEDAAHAFGTRRPDGSKVAGRATGGTCFSFYATKNLSCGEGGAIATDSESLATFARAYRLHGMVDTGPGDIHKYDVAMPGIKANMSDILAALGRSQLRRFPAMQEHRRLLSARYRDRLLSTTAQVLPHSRPIGSADHLLVVDLGDARKTPTAIEQLRRAGIGSSVHFRPLHRLAWFRTDGCELSPSGLPTASRMDGRILCLPLHVGMIIDDVDRVVDVLITAL